MHGCGIQSVCRHESICFSAQLLTCFVLELERLFVCSEASVTVSGIPMRRWSPRRRPLSHLFGYGGDEGRRSGSGNEREGMLCRACGVSR